MISPTIKRLAKSANISFDEYDLAFADNNHNEDGIDLEKFVQLMISEILLLVKNDGTIHPKDIINHFSN